MAEKNTKKVMNSEVEMLRTILENRRLEATAIIASGLCGNGSVSLDDEDHVAEQACRILRKIERQLCESEEKLEEDLEEASGISPPKKVDGGKAIYKRFVEIARKNPDFLKPFEKNFLSSAEKILSGEYDDSPARAAAARKTVLRYQKFVGAK